MGKLTYLLLGALAALPCAAAKPKTPAAPAPEAKAAVIPPSRNASEDLKGYVESLAKQFAIGGRASDPFGQLQDPDAKPVVRPTTLAKPTRRLVAEPPAPLSDIVGRLEITTIMPKDKRFYVGSRLISQGDKVPITFRNKQIKTEIAEVSARRIVFRNLDTGELGTRQLDMLPGGVTRGSRLATPGMVPTQPNAPLEIDSPTMPLAGNPNL